MKTSSAGVAFIAAHEGVVTRAYRDVGGIWTIGAGHTAAAGPPAPKAGMTMTHAAALDLLATDLPAYERDVETALGPVAQTVFDGAVSFHFNTGAIRRASWVGKYVAGDHAAAEASLKAWARAGGKVYAGLVRRRAEEADLIFRGAYPDALKPARGVTGLEDREAREGLIELDLLAADATAPEAIAGAVEGFQAAHDLVVDGIVGPATRACLARALAARRAAKIVIGAGGAGAVVGGTLGADPSASAVVPVDPAGIVLAAIGWGASAALVAGLGFFAWRYRGVLGLAARRLVPRLARTPVPHQETMTMSILKGWRTRLLAVAVALLGMGELFAPNIWATLLPKSWQGVSTIAIAVAIYWLRQLTTTAAGRKA